MTSYWYIVLFFLLIVLNIFCTFFSVSVADFEQVNVSWVAVIHEAKDKKIKSVKKIKTSHNKNKHLMTSLSQSGTSYHLPINHFQGNLTVGARKFTSSVWLSIILVIEALMET